MRLTDRDLRRAGLFLSIRGSDLRSPSGMMKSEGPQENHLRILDVIRRIPPGQVTTYGRVAAAAGLPGRARLVGHVLRSSPLAGTVPWHRVIGASGKISERSGEGPTEQRRRLEAEGVELDSRGRVDWAASLWEADSAGIAV